MVGVRFAAVLVGVLVLGVADVGAFNSSRLAVDVLPADPLPPLQCGEPSPTEAPPPPYLGSLSQPTLGNFTASEHLVPSPDGTRLSVKAYRSLDAPGPLPTIFIFSPYNGALGLYGKDIEGLVVDYIDCSVPYYLARGYNVVVGDMRGTRNSDGCFQMGGAKDQEDGKAIVDWIASQSWSLPAVGMTGVSHVGMSQILTALAQPAALKAIVPNSAPTQFYRYLFQNGAKYVLNTLTPPAYLGAVEGPPPTNVLGGNFADNNADTFCESQGYMAKMLDLTGDVDAFWQERDYAGQAGRIQVPVFLVHGLEDENVKTDHFDVLWDALGASGVVRKGYVTQHGHSEPALPWWNATLLRWFDHWLKGIDTGMMDEAPVTLERSDGTSLETTDWPPPHAAPTSLWLSQGSASFVTPGANTEASYTDVPFVPRAYLRELGGHLLYTTDILEAPLRLTGAIGVELVASVDQEDTNLAVHLYEVEVSGNRTFLTRGYLDARHRDGAAVGVPLVPGEVTTFRLDLYPRSHVVQAGSLLEVVVTSTDFCTWQLEAVEGCDSTGIYSDLTRATVTVREGPTGSRLLLPVERCAGDAAPVVLGVDTLEAGGAPWRIAPVAAQALAGQPLCVEVRNPAGQFAPHSLAITDAGGNVVAALPSYAGPGQSALLEVPGLAAGNYTYYCPIPGHRALGMEGMLAVS